MSDFKYVNVNSVKEGNVIEIEERPCKIMSIEKSKPGKHGAAKARIVGIDVFTDKKLTLLSPSGEDVKAPMITRSNAQVVADMGNTVQLMDLSSYETFEAPKPTEQEIVSKMQNGAEVEYLRMDNEIRVIRVK